MLVLVGDILLISVGDLFMAAMFPGLVLGGLYIAYLLGIAFLAPHKAPAGVVDVDDTRPLWLALGSDLLAPVLLIMGVLGSIVAGIATPTEAAAIGAAGTMVLAAFAGEMSFAHLRARVLEPCRTTGIILFVAIGADGYTVSSIGRESWRARVGKEVSNLVGAVCEK